MVNSDWKIRNPVDFYTFRDRLSIQLCHYDPKKQQYPGDERMRLVSQMPKTMRMKRRYDEDIIQRYEYDGSEKISFDLFAKLFKTKRVCDTLQMYTKHIHSITSHKSKAKCAVCGLSTYKKCSICNVPIHHGQARGEGAGKHCSIIWHDETYLGLCFDDRRYFGIKASNWKQWSKNKLKEHKRTIKGYKSELNMK